MSSKSKPSFKSSSNPKKKARIISTDSEDSDSDAEARNNHSAINFKASLKEEENIDVVKSMKKAAGAAPRRSLAALIEEEPDVSDGGSSDEAAGSDEDHYEAEGINDDSEEDLDEEERVRLAEKKAAKLASRAAKAKSQVKIAKLAADAEKKKRQRRDEEDTDDEEDEEDEDTTRSSRKHKAVVLSKVTDKHLGALASVDFSQSQPASFATPKSKQTKRETPGAPIRTSKVVSRISSSSTLIPRNLAEHGFPPEKGSRKRKHVSVDEDEDEEGNGIVKNDDDDATDEEEEDDEKKSSSSSKGSKKPPLTPSRRKQKPTKKDYNVGDLLHYQKKDYIITYRGRNPPMLTIVTLGDIELHWDEITPNMVTTCRVKGTRNSTDCHDYHAFLVTSEYAFAPHKITKQEGSVIEAHLDHKDRVKRRVDMFEKENLIINEVKGTARLIVPTSLYNQKLNKHEAAENKKKEAITKDSGKGKNVATSSSGVKRDTNKQEKIQTEMKRSAADVPTIKMSGKDVTPNKLSLMTKEVKATMLYHHAFHSTSQGDVLVYYKKFLKNWDQKAGTMASFYADAKKKLDSTHIHILLSANSDSPLSFCCEFLPFWDPDFHAALVEALQNEAIMAFNQNKAVVVKDVKEVKDITEKKKTKFIADVPAPVEKKKASSSSSSTNKSLSLTPFISHDETAQKRATTVVSDLDEEMQNYDEVSDEIISAMAAEVDAEKKMVAAREAEEESKDNA